MPTSAPDITVSIVSYNTCNLLRECLRSLEARRDEGEATLEIVVADNLSHDGSAAMVRDEFPGVKLVEIGDNIGYGRANNRALEDAAGRYFFVLNSDTRVELGALAAMRDFLDAQPEVGAVGAQLVLPDGSIQPSCARDPHLLPVFWEQTYLDKLLPRNRITGAYLMTDWDYQETREVEQVCGACLFVRREAWRQIGGFDAAYFMYFEDTDFCVRMRRAGWKIFFVPAARIHHELGASSAEAQIRARMIASYNASRYVFFGRNFGAGAAALLKLMVVGGALLRLSAWSVLTLRPRATLQARRHARAQTRLFGDVLRRTLAIGQSENQSGNPNSS